MRKGFTLAEVLITLGIIGVVAALTMPPLVANYKKQHTIAQLKKIYSALNQAIRLSEIDNGDYEYWEDGISMGSYAYIEKYWLPYFKAAKICREYSQCGYSTNTPWIDISGNAETMMVASSYLRTPFITGDGIFISISTSSGTGVVPFEIVFIDLNNAKGPNQAGKDLFWFTRTQTHGILPYCYESTDAGLDSDCSVSGHGACCAAKIIKDGWDIKDDYPW